MTQLWMQCQGHGYADWVVAHAKALGGVKLLNPQYGDWRRFADAGVPILGRMVWPHDSDKRHIADGAAGAERWFADFWPTARDCSGITLWEGPNEPTTWTIADAQRLDAFTARLADLYHDNGLRLVGLNYSTGHPEFAMWQHLGNALAKVDYLGRHSYTVAEPWFDRDEWWHAYRLVEDVKAIRAAGLRVPPIVLGETGIDRAGDPERDGWRGVGGGRPLDRNTYTTLLVQYLLRLGSLVPELERACPFTWLSTGWPSFDHDEATSAMLVAKWSPVAAQPKPLPAITPAYLERARSYKVPINPDGALAKSIMAAGQLPASDEFDHNGQAARQWGYRRSDATWHLWEWQAGKAPRIVHTEYAVRE